MRRLLAAAVVAASIAVPAVPAHARTCGGVVDYDCRGWVCSLDCFYRDCAVWLDPTHDPQLARCL